MAYDIKDGIELVTQAKNAWSDIYQAAEDDLAFYGGNQWDYKIYQDRISQGRHAVTINRLPQFVHQVANDIRQNTPTVKVIPADSGADPETAEVLQDYIRNIEYVSNADIIYDTAVENSIKCSIGWIRLDHDYVAPDTFEQHITMKRVPNPLSVMIDPLSMNADGSDAQYGFCIDVLSKEQFKKEYPDASPESFSAGMSAGYSPLFSGKGDEVVIAELFRIEPIERTILQLENGLIVFEDEYKMLDGQSPVVATRKITKNKVKRCKLSGSEILEETDFPSSYIPLVPVYGEEHWYDGKRHLYSLIRNSKDSQRMYNYLQSLKAEGLQKAPKSPWMAAEGQMEGYEKQWQNPDAVNVLPYIPVSLNGTPVPPPQRVAPPPVASGFVEASIQAIDDMKATMGMYDASLGQRGNESSGRAIIARQREGDTATYHFGDNLSRSVQHVGRIMLDMIPRVIDTPRIIRTIGEDGTPKNAMVNGQVPSPDKFDRIHDVRLGRYDVVVTTGPSYATKRVEAAEALIQLTQGNPLFGQVAPDLLVDSLDIPGKEILKKRLKKALPPQLLQGEEGDEEKPDLGPQLQQAEQHIQQTEQMMQQAAQKIEELVKENEELKSQNILKAKELNQDAMIAQAQYEIKDREMDLKEQELAFKEREAAFNLELDHKKMDHDLTKARLSAKISASPDVALLDPDMQDEGVAPLAVMMEQFGQAMMQGFSQIAQAQAQGNSAVISAITAPRTTEIIRNEQGQIAAGVSTVQ